MATEEKNKTIAVVAYPGIALLNLVVTQTVLDRGTKYRTVSVRERTEPIASDTPMAVVPEKRFEEVPHPSVLLVPGERASTFAAMGNEAIRSYVRSASETAEVAGSICTGALVLASVGLLEGRQATTHWVYYKILEQFGAKYVRKRWVEEGKFISSAGVTAGIDMALHLAARAALARLRSASTLRGHGLRPPGRYVRRKGRVEPGGTGDRGQTEADDQAIPMNPS